MDEVNKLSAKIDSLDKELRKLINDKEKDLTKFIVKVEKSLLKGQKNNRAFLEKSIKVLESKIQDLRTYVDGKFQSIEERFEALEKRVEALEKRIEALEKRIDKLEKRIDRRFDEFEKKIDARFDLVYARLNETATKRDVEEIMVKYVDKILNTFDSFLGEIKDSREERAIVAQRLSDHEDRIVRLEDKVFPKK